MSRKFLKPGPTQVRKARAQRKEACKKDVEPLADLSGGIVKGNADDRPA